MAVAVPLRLRAIAILDRLLEHYGKPEWRTPLAPVDELVSTILSQNTNDRNRDVAFYNLKVKYADWKDLLKAPVTEVIAAIRPAGLANQKAPRIQQVLNEILTETGDLDLSFLSALPREDVRKWLMKFNGVGPKTAAIVMQFSLNMPAFPVDTHIYRVTGRLGLRQEKITVEDAHILMEEMIPPEYYYEGHLNLIRLGREICTARKAMCEVCPICDLCEYGIRNKCGQN